MNIFLLFLFKIGEIINVSKKQRNNNYSYNADITKDDHFDGFIENQHNLKHIKVGRENISYAGCGIIAVYNTLLALSRSASNSIIKINSLSDATNIDLKSLSQSEFIKILSYFEKRGLVLYGKFGVSPFSIKKFFKKNGFTVKSLFPINDNTMLAISRDFSTFICTVYNNKNNVTEGIHHIAITKDSDGNYISHNPNTISNSLQETILKATHGNGKPLYIIGIK